MAARRSVPITARKSAFRIVASAVSGRRDKDIIRTYNAICDGDHKKAQYLTSFTGIAKTKDRRRHPGSPRARGKLGPNLDPNSPKACSPLPRSETRQDLHTAGPTAA